jgi:hypothetical protein
MDAAGNLYGAGAVDAANNKDAVYEVDAITHSVTNLAIFDGTHGSFPTGGLVLDASGDLFGQTTLGGANNDGVVFELTPVPEPSSPVLGLLAIGGLPLAARMRKRKD